MEQSSNKMNDLEMDDGGGWGDRSNNNKSSTTDIQKYENKGEHGLLERIYDKGQGEKFNDLIKNPTKIKAMKAFITEDDIDNMINLPPEKTKIGFSDMGGGVNGTTNHVSGNMQDLLSITGFKIIDKLPPTTGDFKNNTNSMIDRFRVSASDFAKDINNNTFMNATKTRWTNNDSLEPKLSRPTTTIINLGEKYSAKAEAEKNKQNKELEDKMREREALEREKLLKENPLEELNKEIDESDQDQYMNTLHKFIRDAFKDRDHKMDFVYYLPSDKENYYELRPKDFQHVAKEKTYYTLSSKGLTVYIDKKPREFIKLAEWINERKRYNVIAEIPFFKNFKIWRIIKMWRKNIFKQKKIAHQNELQNTLLFNNEDYNTRLIEHKKFCNEILYLKIVDMKVGLESNSFQKFQDMQKELRRRNKKKLDDIHNKCQMNFDTSLKSIFAKVRQKINDAHNAKNHNTDDKKGGSKVKDKKKEKMEEKSDDKMDKASVTDQKTNVNDDDIVGFDNYLYEHKMIIKDECKNFVKLAYLFDYIMLDLLRRMFLFSMKDVIDKLDEYNKLDIPPKKENIPNKNGEFVKPPILNPNRVVPYFMVQCKLNDDKSISKIDYIYKQVKPFYVKATPDSEFDPTAHIQIDKEDMEYEKQLQAGKTQKEIMTGELALNAPESIEIKEIKRPHHYFISYDPDCETLKNRFEKEINETLNELKIKGWRAHPRFSRYLDYMDDWDEKYAEWDGPEAKDLNVEEILKEDPIFISKESDISQKIKEAFRRCDVYLERLDPYLQYHWKQKSIPKDILLNEYLKDSDEIFRLIFVYIENAKKVIEKHIPFDEEIGMIKLSLEEGLRKELRQAQSSVIDFLKEKYPDILHERAQKIEKWIDTMLQKIAGDIADEKAFLEKTKAKDVLETWYDINERKLNSLFTIVNILKNKGFEKITSEDVKMFELLNSKKFQLKTTWDMLNDNLNRSQDKLYNSLEKRSIPDLNKRTEEILKPLKTEKFITYDATKDEAARAEEISNNIEELESTDKIFKKIELNAKTYNEFLVVLGQPEHNFSQVEEVREIIDILTNLWKALDSFGKDCENWKKTDFLHLETEQILDKCSEYEIIGRRAMTVLGDKGTAMTELISKVNNFSESMRVVNYLKCPDLSTPYWDRIQAYFPGEEYPRLQGGNYTLATLLEMEVYKFEDQIREIMLEAVNTKKLEQQINDIINKRKEIFIPVNPDKKIIDDFPKIIKSLEECQLLINNVVSSKYAKFCAKGDKNPFKLKTDFEAYLNAIDFLKMFQKKYKYLENILNSGDMKRKLQDNSFDRIDQEWKSILLKNAGAAIGKVLDLKINMQKHARSLDILQQKIEEQLKVMRNAFERFYFISNDDLLFMLANSKSSENKNGKEGIEMIKPYLCKIFEDIYDLKYAAQNPNSMSKEINGIVSLVKEELLLQKNFNEKKVKIDDDLERWLGNLESTINETLKEKMIYAYQFYEEIKDVPKHKTWLQKIIVVKEGDNNKVKQKENETKNISQVVATITHVKFCENTEQAIKDLASETSSLVIWYKRIEQAILSYSQMVNEDFANQDKNLRRIISNLITHHVHYKDIMQELIEVEPAIEDFEWQKQLRSYLIKMDENAVSKNLTVRIKQLKYEYEYGYEYFGPSVRIVISPLTDRVWLTMSSALQIKLGCNLGGPAGTGKTETTKDLAKYFGIQCIVFNCSEQIDYKILGNIFSGLCLHKYGAYACLDEFNRINLEVLSVIATQLFKIRQAQLSGAKNVTIMTDAIDLVGKSGVFITMNPTYSGRSELPDNLKANFRPITMMKPEFSKIAQVKLYSEGFSESDVLSKKLFKLYDLAQQQLSQQDHYDFTLRTLGTVLSMAGNLKRSCKCERSQLKLEEDKIIFSSLKDANFPKFVAEDIKLFNALLNDLFPNVELEEKQTKFFDEQINIVIENDKLDPSPFTIEKCKQLIDIMNIRLGICLTGAPGSGKTTVIHLVEKVSTKIRKENNELLEKWKEKEKEKERQKENEDHNKQNSEKSDNESDNEEEKKKKIKKVEEEEKKPVECDPKYKLIKSKTINPKSITMGELFGEENEEKKIFEYGIATKKIKKALADEGEDKYNMVILDGPIDTKWIENMNSVLDDTQTLCLANGERIKLKSHVKILFEVEDLSKASLATVSRLGVIYFGPTELGWRPYAHYWMKTFFKDETILPKELQNYVSQLFEDKVDDVIDNMEDLQQSGCCFIKPTISSMIQSLCHLLEFYLTIEHGFVGRNLKGLDNQDQLGRYKKWIIMCFALAMVWGMFGGVNNRGSPRVESFIRNKFNEIKLENSQVIMEHYYDFQNHEFVKFSTDAEKYKFKYEKGMPFSSIYVPTIDSLRYSFILEVLLNARKNVYVTGESGTGKTAIIQNIIKSINKDEDWTFIRMNFSAQTSSKEIQSNLEKKLEQERGKKHLWGAGGKKCLIYIDDINMPEPNEWGAHPPIELLRQYLDQGGWYDRPQLFFKWISNTNMIVAGGPAVGGRSMLTDRFTRHFTLICFPQPNKQVLNYIFENILKGFFTVNVFSEVVKKYTIETTTSTIELYEFMLSNMKPIPSKFHYIFNLRDISRVFQGILMIESRYFTDHQVYIKLWIHEIERVFCDRLTNAQDLKEVRDCMCSLLRQKFKTNYTYDQLYKHGEPIYFGEVHKGKVPNRPYEYIEKHENLLKQLKGFVDYYNSENRSAKISLVFFDYFIAHILRVCRVLRQQRGNMVLIGHGGSGKQTVCHLSSYIMTGKSDRFVTFSAPRDFKIDEFRKILKDIIHRALFYPVVLLLNDNNVGQNFILENINNFLNNGEIPGLLETGYDEPLPNFQVPKDLTYESFVEISRGNLHILFCTSPVGENLRMRMRKFPALINCCMIDWFMPWPQSALISCSTKSFEKLPYEEEIKDKLVKLVCEAHSYSETLRDDFFDELGRKVYITPKTFLDMNDLLINLIKTKKTENEEKIRILEQGTEKIDKTREDIKRLENEILILLPKIEENSKFLDEYLEQVNAKNLEVRKQKEEVVKTSAKAKAKRTETEKLITEIRGQRDECQFRFKKIKARVDEELKDDTLLQFAKEKANELKTIVPEALAYLLKKGRPIKPDEKSYAYQVYDERDKIKKIEDEIKNNSISDNVFEEFKKYIHEKIPTFFERKQYKANLSTIEEKLGSLSKTHQILYMWGKGVIELWEIDKKLRPIQEEHDNKKRELDELNKQVKELQKEQEEKEKELNHLEAEYQKSKAAIEDLEKQKQENEEKKQNAKTLIELLKDENERWKEQLKQLHEEENNFLGDIIVSALFLSYLSPFSGSYRNKAVQTFLELCIKYQINVTKDFSLQKIMCDVVQIRQWTMSGLPNDSVSIENAIMFTNNNKFPLLIDPQLQGNQWIKKMYKGNIEIYKADCKEEKLKSQFESIGNDMTQGRITMLENVTEVIDTVYAPIINQEIVDDNGLRMRFNGYDREYSKDFKMFFTTKIANPHYPPEYYIKLNIINFTVTQSGLSEQLLSEVFKCERRDKYEQRDKIIAEMGRMNDELAKLSKDILQQLADTPEDKILEAVGLIQTLQKSKVASDEVSKSMKQNIEIEAETNELRNGYIPVSKRGSILYFVVASMCKIDPMYQFSLEYFKKLFIASISYKEENSKTNEERVKFLEKKITEDIYKNIKRGIFESHKTVFSFLIDINIRKERGEISEEEFSLFVKGPSSMDTSEMLKNPDEKFFSEFQWNSILYLENKFNYINISNVTKDNLDKIKKAFESIDNLDKSFDDLIKPVFENVGGISQVYKKNFLKLLFIKIYKPDRLLYFIKNFIKDDLGELFIDTSPSRLEEVYQESDWKTPIIFILSKGADPTNEFLIFKDRFEKIRKEKYEEELKRKEEEKKKELERLLREEEEEKEREDENEGEGEENHEKPDNKQEEEQQQPAAEEPKENVNQENNQENSKENNNENNGNEKNENNENGENGELNKSGDKNNSQKDENEQKEEEQNAYEFNTYIISLGQGQEEEAKKAILEYGIKEGAWVLLQNCHLFTSFMPDLASIVQSLQQDYTDVPVDIKALPNVKKEEERKNSKAQNHENQKKNEKGEKPHHEKEEKSHKKEEKDKDPNDNVVNPNFRLWLTSMPVQTFPVSILQNSLKITTEPPSGIKSNMRKLFNDISEEKQTAPIVPTKHANNDKTPEEEAQEKKDNITKGEHFDKILYSLSLFHAVIQERKKFGPIGFNLRYDFNQGDFDTSSKLVNIYLYEADVDYIPWDSIIYLIGEVTYGGSIVDETDRIVMTSTLNKFINENLFEKKKDENGNDLDEEMVINFGKYSIPVFKNLDGYQNHIKSLPDFDTPDIFGLNDNANIVYQLKESGTFLNNLTNVLPKEVNVKSGGKTSNDIVMETINNVFFEQFEVIDKKAKNKIHDKIYDNELKHPLTIVLGQEIDRYNNLLIKIDTSLKELKGAIEGTTIMSNESDEIYNSLLINKIPYAWSKISYSSFKPFGSWITDLKKRIEFIMDWLVNGHPATYWLSGLFYPQGFITGVYQNHARETKKPISDIILKFEVMNIPHEKIEKAPSCGIYVYGLFLEGASWDDKLGLIDQKPGEMRFNMPLIWFKTCVEVEKKEDDDDDDGAEEEIFTYSCPLFKTGKRASIIASSGNSNEKIIDVDLTSRFNKDYWILRGAALLSQLDE